MYLCKYVYCISVVYQQFDRYMIIVCFQWSYCNFFPSSFHSFEKELIAAITVENPTHICLSNKSFDNDAATVIANYIHTLENITTGNVIDIYDS